MNISRLMLLCSVAPMALAMATPLRAQQTAAGAPQPGVSGKQAGAANYEGIEDIIVTAQRRTQMAIKTPLSLTALNGDALKDHQVTNLVDLMFISPGIRSGYQTGINRVFIRGIGLTSFAFGADSSVAYYVDGVYVGRPAAQLASFYDVERMEVLRGPQGALYGRNATGGAINLISKEPTTELGGYVNMTGGNYGLNEGEAALNIPLTGNGDLRARFATHLLNRDGYGTDIAQNHPVNDAHSQDARGTIQYNPSSAVDVKLIGEYHHENDNNNYNMSFGAYPGYVLQGVTGVTTGPNAVLTPPGTLLKGIAVINSQDAATDLKGKTNFREGYALTLNGTFELSDALSLTSITGWRKYERTNAVNINGTSAPGGSAVYTETSKQTSQEFLLNYSSSSFEAVVGASYFHENIDVYELAPLLSLDRNYIIDGYMNIDAYAAYAQGTYSVTPQFRLTAGVRYSDEKRDQVGTFSFGATSNTSGKKSWSDFNPTFRVEYDLAPQTLAYASVTNGFKSGTYNIGQVNPAINPEKIWAYEAGLKTRLMDNKMEISGAIFHYDYSDLQVNKIIGVATVTTNAASAKTTGAELSIRLKPVSQLTIDSNLTYLDAEFSDFNSTNPLYPLGPTDPGFANYLAQNPGASVPVFVNTREQVLKGNMLPGSPKWQATFGAQYDISLPNDASLTTRGEVAYSSRIYFSEFNDHNLSQGPVAKVNLSLRYDSGKSWTFTAWGKNVTNALVAGNKTLTLKPWGYPIYGSVEAPATFGGTLGVQF